MELKSEKNSVVTLICVCTMFFCIVISTIVVNSTMVHDGFGSNIVRLMYDFDDMTELSENYAILHNLVSEEVWDKISIDNELRVINSYYKFKAEKSSVVVVYEEPGLVMYKIKNSYIQPNMIWVLEYQKSGHKVTDIREYYCVKQINHNLGR